MKGKPDTRNRLLDAAAGIVAQSGAANLTIDAVAAHAGLSKGGVLYHFPSKKALLQGMLERLITEFQTRSLALRAEGGPSLLHTHVESVLNRPAGEAATSLAVIANAAEDPSLLEPAQALLRERADEIISESTDPVLALVVLLASEGIRFLEVMNLQPVDADMLQKVGDRLFELAAEARS
jgi:AcrR family transcriptional regulator